VPADGVWTACSLLTPGVPIYPPDHMAELHTHYLAVPDETAKSFHDKL
jgi:hypothetical protein